MKGECSCYAEYPNEFHKRKNGNWICVDKYVCVRKRGKYKTKCMRKDMVGVPTWDDVLRAGGLK